MGAFRMAWGILMALHIGHELFTGSCIPRYSDSYLHFTYSGFGWVQPLPELLLKPVMWLALASAIMVALGLLFRLSALVFFLVYSYLFLIDLSYYNNHYYLMLLVSGIIIFLNMNRSLALDALIFKRTGPSPLWQRRLLAFHIMLVYFFGGMSKLFNPEWMSGEAMSEMLASRMAVIGMNPSQQTMTLLAQTMTYGGVAFDLAIGGILLWRRAFWFGAIGVILFNLTNAFTFNIGVFPYIMMAGLLLFVPQKEAAASTVTKGWIRPLVLVPYIVLQLLLPLRHLLIPGDSFWTSEGYLFSWNMKPGTKAVDATFFIRDKQTGLSYTIDPREHLSPPAYLALGKYPLVVPQFAQFLRGKASSWLIASPMVTADVKVSRNSGPYLHVVRPDMDLSEVKFRPWRRNTWIIENPEPFDPS